MAWTYILRCNDGSYYTGSTIDLERRLWEHNEGFGANFTAKRRPVVLVFAEESESIETAFRREKQVQGWSRAKKEALIAREWHRLPGLSRSESNALRQAQGPVRQAQGPVRQDEGPVRQGQGPPGQAQGPE
jgi:putative endonuclease